METREATANYRLSEWASIIQERVLSGELVEDFCMRKGIGKHKYYYWQQKLRKAAGEHLMKQESKPTELAVRGFAEVQITEPPLAPPATGYDQIIIEIGSSRIIAGSGYSTDSLMQILQELKKPC